ncbi:MULTISPECIES: DUF2141 domain-containing protein [Olleya]|uniref:Uncharacterized conserved protein, DUF2141 family n=1 Tax=Olleya namhaensis TaxID=1144750 RepID=A0A1I3PJU4_9FLAO|nr:MULTISPECIES: DUF2141 domain-containing protein [Olleya]PKG51410.1 DUF2141 domain-containing protein [Olleya sp. 1-3]SFJ21306.1 Uncharacterized conserved protein, DUF2141 family [Olleya namhaensis]
MKTLTTSNPISNKLVSTLFLFVLSITFAFGQTKTVVTEGKNITITVKNVKNNTGQVMVALHTADTWMKGQGLQNINSKIENNQVSITFKNVTPGTYAIMVLHDENTNNRMDFDNGMPTENYGMSNNPMSYGPPQFSESKFEINTEDLEFNIRF